MISLLIQVKLLKWKVNGFSLLRCYTSFKPMKWRNTINYGEFDKFNLSFITLEIRLQLHNF